MSEKLLKIWTDAKAAGDKWRKTHKLWERKLTKSVDNILQSIADEWAQEEGVDDEEEGEDESSEESGKKDN